MKKSSSLDIRNKLLHGGFQARSEPAQQMADPLDDTPMVLTLDQLRPYEHNPRMKKNPLYDELKESIRERGLDQPPPVTRRPGEEFYIIRNGGNTRLQVLNDLWVETRDEKFYRIRCLFRPWSARGEIVALTGHLAENDMHGALTFIERALGVEHARQMYEQEVGEEISQRELARRLKADGYPISNSHISRMQDAVRYLLPAIPTLLHGGLGTDQVIKITALRRALAAVWDSYGEKIPANHQFDDFFQDALASFDSSSEPFSIARFQDELLGRLSSLISVDYNLLELDLEDVVTQNRRAAPSNNKVSQQDIGSLTELQSQEHPAESNSNTQVPPQKTSSTRTKKSSTASPISDGSAVVVSHEGNASFEQIIVDALAADAAINDVDSLRLQAAQLASEIAISVGLQDELELISSGIGFTYRNKDGDKALSPLASSTKNLLASLAGSEPQVTNLGALLLGLPLGNEHSDSEVFRLNDDDLIRLFRLIRVARRLVGGSTVTSAGDSSR
ncbi:transcriptional regulators [Pseudomonas luteola]|uniref:Transcriptional regulators n=1 Tax=Pseudomonas luteola TaxID=47886 RepID=A0A2X2C3C1_PSELU|nr:MULTISPECIES: ParB family protein [Pseudomonas]SPZ02527.1 transcriptional regulators [Pseudomonas luteola]